MATFHVVLAELFAFLLDPFARLRPLLGLTLISALSGVVIVVAFRFTSRPEAIRTARRRVQAHLLAVRLYRDDLRVVFRSQLSLLGRLTVYLGNMLLPFVALLVPFGLLFGHLDARYDRRALHPGEEALVTAVVTPATIDQWRLTTGDGGIVVDSRPVRIPERGEITWRVRAVETGRHELFLIDGQRKVPKQALVDTAATGAAPQRSVATLASLFLAPTESPIPAAAGVRSVDIDYPPLPLVALGWHLNWILVFLVVSAAAALLLRKRVGAEF
jgi:hypothetical protein